MIFNELYAFQKSNAMLIYEHIISIKLLDYTESERIFKALTFKQIFQTQQLSAVKRNINYFLTTNDEIYKKLRAKSLH